MRILVVGDKDWERKQLCDAVEALGHEHFQAPDGDQGWQACLELCPDVVLSDYIMPGRNGRELCREVRNHKFENYVYFVILSTLSERGDVLEGMRAGADDYLPKPVDLEALEARLMAASRVTSLHKKVADQRNELRRLNVRLRDESRRDALTQVGNRLSFNDDAREFLDAFKRYGHTVCFALCDIDKFKQYNDTYGHLAGDENLHMVAQHLEKGTRASDKVYRFGGEEFLVVFRESDLETSRRAAERLREALQKRAVTHIENPPHGVVTLTFGLSMLDSAEPGGLEAALNRADEALYHGKESGRNRVVLYAEMAR